MKLQFSDGMEFDTSGELRKELRSDGWYVLGQGMLCPADDEAEADRILERLRGRFRPETPPIYELIDSVKAAVKKYDESDDHIAHGPGADCVRCKAAEAVNYSVPPPRRRTGRSRPS